MNNPINRTNEQTINLNTDSRGLAGLRRFAGATVFALGALFLATACSGSDSDSNDNDRNDDLWQGSSTEGSQANVGAWCQALCDSRKRCDSTYDTSTCLSSCKNTNAAIIPKMRTDVIESDIACFGNLDCATIFSGEAISECGRKSAASVAPTPAGQTFCSSFDAKVSDCGGSASEGDCLSFVKVYADSAANEAAACLSKSCSDVTDCIDAALGS